MKRDSPESKEWLARIRPDWPRPNAPSIKAALERVYRSGDWGRYHGDECRQLQAELSLAHGGREVLLCSSGTIAVELALRAAGVKAGEEVALAAYDFPGNFRAIEAIGARPVVVDLTPERWTLGVDTLSDATSDELKAVIVSHLHGTLADMPEIMKWARSENVAVIEDACQTPGARLAGQTIGSFGDVSVLSFGGSKLLTAGRGGAVLCQTAQQAQRIRVFSERGNDAFPLSELQAAVIRAQLAELESDNETRAKNAARLYRLTSVIDSLEQPTGLMGGAPAYYKLGWWTSSKSETAERNQASFDDQRSLNRDEASLKLQQRGLAVDAGFRGFASRSERRCRRVGELRNARRAADKTLILHHPVLLESHSTIDAVGQIFVDIFGC